jgi:hypothetical protein
MDVIQTPLGRLSMDIDNVDLHSVVNLHTISKYDNKGSSP